MRVQIWFACAGLRTIFLLTAAAWTLCDFVQVRMILLRDGPPRAVRRHQLQGRYLRR